MVFIQQHNTNSSSAIGNQIKNEGKKEKCKDPIQNRAPEEYIGPTPYTIEEKVTFTHSPDAVSEAASRLSALPPLLQQFEIVHTKIEEVDIVNDEQHSLERDDFETKYYSTASKLTRLIKPTLRQEISDVCDTNATYREQTPQSRIEWYNVDSFTFKLRSNYVDFMKIASSVATKCTIAAQSIKDDFYMDDYISGSDSVEEALTLLRDVSEALSDIKGSKINGMSLHNTYCWTDSTVALTWIQREFSQWKTYIANRVAQINEVVKQQNWSHALDTVCTEPRVCCRNQNPFSGGLITKGPLKCLSPFMKDGVLYVGGRLQHSDEPFGRKHTAVLLANNNITNMIFQALHLRLLHIGPQGLLANMRSEFWPLRGRDNARKIVYSCKKCFRARPITLQQPMGQLPRQRITPSKPFSITGVDFIGPIQVKTGLRKIVLVKAYISVFVCMATKAVHLELVSSLTSEAFLAALRRFTSRRGLPSQIWSDNGTNFVGARKELRRHLASTPNTKSVAEILVDDGIQWVFIPPNAPHFGGL
ncbi:hypothetical protein QTP88_017875 [Uroleucon formosanum]